MPLPCCRALVLLALLPLAACARREPPGLVSDISHDVLRTHDCSSAAATDRVDSVPLRVRVVLVPNAPRRAEVLVQSAHGADVARVRVGEGDAPAWFELPAGHYRVRASQPGYRSIGTAVELGGACVAELRLLLRRQT